MTYYISPNRILYEKWEDREYKIHLKKLEEIKKQTCRDNSESIRFPTIDSKIKNNQMNINRENQLNLDTKSLDTRVNRSKLNKGRVDNWNIDYEKHKLHITRMRFVLRDKFLEKLEKENLKIAKRIDDAKGIYSVKKWENSFNDLERVKSLRQNFYTPRGVGYRKNSSLPSSKNNNSIIKQEKSILTLLNEAVNQFERADLVVMKTLLLLDNKERVKIKEEFEYKYNTDLKKGLLKVIDKELEQLVNILLTDNNEAEVDRICESLYEPNDAALVVTEALILRTFEEKDDLLQAFESKIDSTLATEISDKIDGDIEKFLLALLENNRLDSEEDIYEEKIESDVHLLIQEEASLMSTILLDILRTCSRRHLKSLFNEFKSKSGNSLSQKFEKNKLISKALKTIESCIFDPDAYIAEKLHRSIKTNKVEFMRLFLNINYDQLEPIMTAYQHEYNVHLETVMKQCFKEPLIRFLIKRIHNSKSQNKRYQ